MRLKVNLIPLLVKKIILAGIDVVCISLVFWTLFFARFDVSMATVDEFFRPFSALVVFSIPIFARFGMYRIVLRRHDAHAYFQIALGCAASAGVLLALTLLPGAGMPRWVFLAYGGLLLGLIAASRSVGKYLLNRSSLALERVPVAIFGAGACGRQLASMLRLSTEYRAVAFIDDDKGLHGRVIDGMPILHSGTVGLEDRLHRLGVLEVFLALPSVSRRRRREILDLLNPMAFHVRTVPGLTDIVSGKARVDQLLEVSIEDLLGRGVAEPIAGAMEACISGKVVLVTGAGGSIGSELCRQVIGLRPKQLILLDHSEFALYQIEMELRARAGGIPVVAVLGSVISDRVVSGIFSHYAIDSVYHAAAYKHVPIVEENPVEGVRNNVEGTRRVAEAAFDHGVSHFVLISTDKAVRPTNVMGASKRLAELLVQAMAERGGKTIFCMVRFGNVLDSSGSVVPLFRKQIEQGGPVTLTHPEVTRFFMTIPEAVQLVIQAGGMATGGEVFLLDMGEPVKIMTLAENMIRLSGLTVRDEINPDGDIEIRITGLRPGEKLFEELLIGDNASGTLHPLIMRAEESSLPWNVLRAAFEDLERLLRTDDHQGLRAFLQRYVTGYRPNVETVAIAPAMSDEMPLAEVIAINRDR